MLLGGRSSMVERPPVEGKVAGSIPVDHPHFVQLDSVFESFAPDESANSLIHPHNSSVILK